MKNLIKYSFVALLAAFAFTACSDDDDSTSRGSIPAGNQVFFDKSLPTQIDLSKAETSFTVSVTRYIADKEQEVKIELTDTSNLFTAPSEINFAAGETVASLVISYDPAKLEYNDYKSLSLTIAADQATPYANAVYSFTAGVPLTYTSLGKGTYVDSWFVHEAEVEILKCDQQPGTYRVVKPYAKYDGDGYFIMEGKMDDYLDLTILQPGEVLAGITITMNDLVVFPDHLSGALHPSYQEDGSVMLTHPSGFAKLSVSEANFAHNKVLEYQTDGTPGIIQLAPYYYIMDQGGWNQTAEDDQILIYFPGNAPKDYSIETTYTGTFNNVAGEPFAMGEVSFGADIDAIKGIVVSAKENIETVAEKVASGVLEAVDLAKGSVVLPITKGLEGKLQLVIVGFTDGEVVAAKAAIFEYYGMVNPWKSIGKGQLTENLLSTLYGLEAMTYEVEIEENTKNPGYYRIIDAFAPVAEALSNEYEIEYTPVNFEIDATDAEGVYIPMQSTGVDDGDGLISVACLGGYFLQQGYEFDMLKGYGFLGTLENGVISLLEPMDSDDETYTLQGVAVQGENEFDTGINSEFKLVLPSADARTFKAAAKKAAAKNWKNTPWKRAARKVSFKKSKPSKQFRYASKFQRNIR